ncbi:MAG: lytic transglycosylase domain-containing protein [Rickettsiales bacterium]|nr:lytic transglycosylase domain-containing protein [Rickettsiales bacterium]
MLNPIWRYGLLCVLWLISLSPASADTSKLFYAIENKHWGTAMREAQGKGMLGHVVQWHFLQDEDAEVSFAQIHDFMQRHQTWPGRSKLQIRAEKLLFQNGSPDARAWFAKYPPISGYGLLAKARLGGAKKAELVKRGFEQGDFEKDDDKQIIKEFRDFLSVADYRKRIERLLEEDKATIASRYLKYVDKKHRRLYDARISLIRKDRDVDRAIDRVPNELIKDHGLMVDRTVWRHKKNLISGTIQLLKEMHPDNPLADKVWKIRALHARDYIEVGNYKGALALLVNYGNKLSPANNAEALWMLGWLQLEFFNNPKEAYKAFFQLNKQTSYPISKSRGAFWSARAAEMNKNKEIADGWYKVAAQYPTTFYGQLAFHKLNPGKPLKLPKYQSNPATVDFYMQHPLVRLAKQLKDIGQSRLATPFINHLAQEAKSEMHMVALAEAVAKLGLMHGSVRVAKFATRDNLILLPHGWPITQIGKESTLEPALPHAIARQESEFNPEAVSLAGARGLMQLMPATAKRVARSKGMGYSRKKLFEPSYNATLGSSYLQGLVERFEGNYILAIAGYNAGPGRSEQWVRRFGRPGRNIGQTLRWIEMIPFSETRNYVQRVLENAQVYRALMKPDAPLNIAKDLLR